MTVSFMYVVVLAYSDHGIVMISVVALILMFGINLGKARRR